MVKSSGVIGGWLFNVCLGGWLRNKIIGRHMKKPVDPKAALKTVDRLYRRALSEFAVLESIYTDKRNSPLVEMYGHFFASIQRPLMDSMILGIARLLDPAVQGRHQNASLMTVSESMERSDLTEAIRNIQSKNKELIDLRKQVIAHADYERNGNDVVKYNGASHDEAEGCLDEIRKILEMMHQDLHGDSVDYVGTHRDKGGPEALFDTLRMIDGKDQKDG